MLNEVTKIQTRSDLNDRIRTPIKNDQFYTKISPKMQGNKLFQQKKEYKIDETWLLWSKKRLYVL